MNYLQRPISASRHTSPELPLEGVDDGGSAVTTAVPSLQQQQQPQPQSSPHNLQSLSPFQFGGSSSLHHQSGSGSGTFGVTSPYGDSAIAMSRLAGLSAGFPSNSYGIIGPSSATTGGGPASPRHLYETTLKFGEPSAQSNQPIVSQFSYLFGGSTQPQQGQGMQHPHVMYNPTNMFSGLQRDIPVANGKVEAAEAAEVAEEEEEDDDEDAEDEDGEDEEEELDADDDSAEYATQRGKKRKSTKKVAKAAKKVSDRAKRGCERVYRERPKRRSWVCTHTDCLLPLLHLCFPCAPSSCRIRPALR